jgi:transcriptional regulator with XRE-family HTH domain
VDDTPGDRKAGLPEREVTVNMLVAYNMTRWRQASGMTQAALGEELGGWTKTAVSAAERSWDGKRVRKFDADEIADMASVFSVPLLAFFLPPADDGVTARYVIRDGGDGPVPMDEYFRYLLSDPDQDAGTPAAVAFQQAVITATAKYIEGEEATEDLAASIADLAAAEQVKAVLERSRANRQAVRGIYPVLDALLEENAMLQDALERALRRREEPEP